MEELCKCALSECRIFQALVHSGLVVREEDYEEYISPPCACKAGEAADLYDDVVHDVIDNEASSESVACDLAVDTMEDGFSLLMRTTGGSLLRFIATVGDHDLSAQLMRTACETSSNLEYNRTHDLASMYEFPSIKCMVELEVRATPTSSRSHWDVFSFLT